MWQSIIDNPNKRAMLATRHGTNQAKQKITQQSLRKLERGAMQMIVLLMELFYW